ncbi:hypothetical protein [Streptomyces sp. NPDC051286]|uniref:hypothetical protein n=1 Tax=Streptomyces sp. NPDC051286 TaxID=3365647 RepID=UPI0037904755
MHADERTLKAFADWSSCMKQKGYDYKDPWAANNDPKWAPTGRSEEAISTAKADVTCRQEHSVTEVMHQVEVEWQNKLIEENPKTIADAKSYSGRVMGRVNSALGR